MREVGNIDRRGKSRFQTHFEGEFEKSMTVQSDAHLADIQNIMRQYGQGAIQLLDEAELQFRDVTEFTDLADAMNQAREAEVVFMRLPSKVREIFDHDVAVWLDTAHDEEKRDALVAAGFIERKEVAGAPSAPEAPAGPGETPAATGEGSAEGGQSGGQIPAE